MRFPKIGMPLPLRPPLIIATADGEEGAVDSVPFRTRRHYWKGVVWLLIALAVQSAASLFSEEVETYYSQNLFYFVVRGLSSINKLAKGFALGEVFFVIMIVWFFSWAIWYLRRSFRRETRFYHVLKVFFLQILWVMSILVPFFLALWGLNYQRSPLNETLGIDRIPTARSGDFGSIELQIISGINRNYTQSRGSRDSTSDRRPPPSFDTMYRSVEQAFQNEKILGEAAKGPFSDPKPLYLSHLSSWAGVTGFYIPFTGEVAFNKDTPSSELPMTLAHQKAHQRGYAREDEANFIGYLACVNSSDPYVRYSGYLYGLKVVKILSKGNTQSYEDMISRLDDGPRADIREDEQFWEKKKDSFADAVGRRIFSAYLRANRVPGGVKNFDEDVPLIIGYYLKNPNRQEFDREGGEGAQRFTDDRDEFRDRLPESRPRLRRSRN